MVKIRLTRLGRKKRPFYRIVVIDSRKQRDGDYIEKIGLYDPLDKEKGLVIDEEKSMKWLMIGAQPTDVVAKLFRTRGILLRYDMLNRLKREKVEKDGKVKYLVVKDADGNPVRKFTDAQIEEAYKNWVALKEKNEASKKDKSKLSKKAKAKIVADKKAAEDAKIAAAQAAEEAKAAAAKEAEEAKAAAAKEEEEAKVAAEEAKKAEAEAAAAPAEESEKTE